MNLPNNFLACYTCYSVVKLQNRLSVLPKMVSFPEVSLFVIWLIGELGWAKPHQRWFLLLQIQKASAQHKWSISVHCLEFRKTPSAALWANVGGFFFLFLLLWGKHASQHIETLVFSMWALYLSPTGVGGNYYFSEFLKEFWQNSRNKSPKGLEKLQHFWVY